MSLVRQESFNDDPSSGDSTKRSPPPPDTAEVTSGFTSAPSDISRTMLTSIAKGSVKTEVQYSSSSSSATSSQGSAVSHEKRETVTHTVVGVGVTTCGPDVSNGDILTALQSNVSIAKDVSFNGGNMDALNLPSSPPGGCITDDLIGFGTKEFNIPESSSWLSEGFMAKSDGVKSHVNINHFLQGEIQRRDRMIEDLLSINPLPAFPVKSIEGRVVSTSVMAATSSADELRSELAAATVKMNQQEEDLRETRTTLSKKEGRLQELTRQLDAHRQEHARQAATIVSLRQRLQDECDMTSRLSGQQRRAELTLAALTRENKQYNDRILELESRLRTHLEERESAEQRSEASQKRLLSLLRVASSALSIEGELELHDGPEKLSVKLGELVQECGYLRGEVSRLTESNCQLEESAGHGRQTVTRLVNELDEQKVTNDEQRKFIDDIQKECDSLRIRARSQEEEVKSIRERLHATNRSYNSTLEELHNAEKVSQISKDEALVAEHRRLQAETEWRGFLTTLAALLSTPAYRVSSDIAELTEKIHSLVTSSKENMEQAERLAAHTSSLEEQNKRQTELYNSALKRARQADADAQASALRARQLEAELTASENARENITTEREKAMSLMSRVVDALGLKELGEEVTKDVELVVCRAQQLARLEGEKIVDKTTTVYQLQRRLKSCREAVERKDLHVDMLRRKLSMVEESSRASSLLTEERDEAVARMSYDAEEGEELTSQQYKPSTNSDEAYPSNCDSTNSSVGHSKHQNMHKMAASIMHAHFVNLGCPGQYAKELNKMLTLNNLPPVTATDNPNSVVIIQELLDSETSPDHPVREEAQPQLRVTQVAPEPKLQAQARAIMERLAAFTSTASSDVVAVSSTDAAPPAVMLQPDYKGKGIISPIKGPSLTFKYDALKNTPIQDSLSVEDELLINEDESPESSRPPTPVPIRCTGPRFKTKRITKKDFTGSTILSFTNIFTTSKASNPLPATHADDIGLKIIVPAIPGKSTKEAYLAAQRKNLVKFTYTNKNFNGQIINKMLKGDIIGLTSDNIKAVDATTFLRIRSGLERSSLTDSSLYYSKWLAE